MPKTIKERLSRNEGKLLDLLPTDGSKVATSVLAVKFYNGSSVPTNGRVIITGLVRGLQKKCLAMDDCTFFVKASERAGPRPIEVWLEMKLPATA